MNRREAKSSKEEKRVRRLEDKALALLRRAEELRKQAHEIIRETLK